jgi:hypothetical protein
MTTDDLSKKAIEYLVKQAEDFQEENKRLLTVLQDRMNNRVIDQEREIDLLKKEIEQLIRENNWLTREIEEYKAKYKQMETIAAVWQERWLRIIESLGKMGFK